MPNRNITLSDREKAAKFFENNPQFFAEDFTLLISNNNNIIIRYTISTRKGNDIIDIANLNRRDGRVKHQLRVQNFEAALVKSIRNPDDLAEINEIEAKRGKPTPFFQLGIIEETKVLVEKELDEKYSSFFSTFDVRLNKRGMTLSISFEPANESIWVLETIEIRKYLWATYEQDIESIKRKLRFPEMTISEFGEKTAVDVAMRLCSEWRDNHKEIAKDFTPDANYLRGISSSAIKTTDTVCSGKVLRRPYVPNGCAGKGRWTIKISDIGIDAKGSGEKAQFDSNTKSKLSKCLWAYEKRKEIVDILDRLEKSGIPFSFTQPKKHKVEIVLSGKKIEKKVLIDLDQPYKRDLSRLFADLRKEDTEALDEDISRICEDEMSGRIIALAIAEIVIANEDFITANAVAKRLRGLRLKQDDLLEKTPYDAKFNIIPEEQIKRVIGNMVSHGYLREKFIEGHYGNDYYILKTTDLTKLFSEIASSPEEQRRRLGCKRASKREIVKLEAFGRQCTGKETLNRLEYLMNHPAIWCVGNDVVDSWLRGSLDEETRAYLQLRMKLEDNRNKKKYYKMLFEASLESE